jgi:hypothetical protein
MKGPAPRNRLAALLCIVLGAIPIGLASGLIPSEPGAIHAPRYIIALAGLLFWVAAIALFLGNTRPRLNQLLGAILLALFAAIGGWVALFGESRAFGGGVPLASSSSNVSLARIVFGVGALLCAGLSLYAFRKAFARVA